MRPQLVKLLLFGVLLDFGQFLSAKNLTPLRYGLEAAKTDIERYEVLLHTHKAAIEQRCGVTYKGIKRIEIEIPNDAVPIPLSYNTNFAGVEIVVRNNHKRLSLFEYTQNLAPIIVSKEYLAKGDFTQHKELCNGKKMIIIEDQTPWVEKRSGYNYGATRKDVVLIEKGVAQNRPIATYNNEDSKPIVRFCDAKGKFVFKNLIFTRSEDSRYVTNLINISNCNNVTVSNVTINTPQETSLYADCCFEIANCANLYIKGVTVNGTYSKTDKFGYGFSLDNILNSRFTNLIAHGNWGVFGTNNMNHVVLENSDINRFDIHCYGRDVYCRNVIFRDLYNQFSSVFGEVAFTKCTFINFIPVLFESSYNAYTPFDLFWNDCTFYFTREKNYCVTVFYAPTNYNKRSELKRKSLPNISMKNCKVQLEDGVKEWYLFQTDNSRYNDSYDYIRSITVSNVEIRNREETEFTVFSKDIETTEEVNTNIRFVRKKNGKY